MISVNRSHGFRFRYRRYNRLMCSNYRPSTRELLQQHFGVAPPDSDYKPEAYPGYMAPMIRLPRADATSGDRACALGMFGMVPQWADTKLARQTYNARTETVATRPSFRSAYKRGQFCIIPVISFFEPSYESGKAERYEIIDVEGAPLGIAGIWEHRKDGPNGLPLLSFSMLTINADGHPLMQRFHKPNDEKRMLVILRPDQYDDWLTCATEDAPDFFTRYPADRLVAQPAPKPGRKPTQATLPDL
jgi:putative SOS response-associated peptidase YedK